jgi:hypothetical protein
MKLENKNQRPASFRRFIIRILRYNIFAFSLVVFSIGIGTLGYHYFSDLKWVDSVHMSSLILTGMGPVVEIKTIYAKLFSSFYALYSGIAFLSITAVFFAPIIHRLLHILHVEDEDFDYPNESEITKHKTKIEKKGKK